MLTLIKEKGGYKFIFNIALANNTFNRFLNFDELIKVPMVCLWNKINVRDRQQRPFLKGSE